MLIPKFSWWYYKSIADEVNGRTLQYPLYEDGKHVQVRLRRHERYDTKRKSEDFTACIAQ